MPRSRFKKIKSYIHVCNNEHIDPSDKWEKLRILFDVVNRKVAQFGVFEYILGDTDERCS